MPDTGPLELFDAGQVAAIAAEIERSKKKAAETRSARIRQRIHARRAKSEAVLAEQLPARIAAGDSWHVMSGGDVDALSYLAHAIKGVPYFDLVAISTWCMARQDLDALDAWLNAGTIDRLELYVGEIFPNQYGDEWELANRIARNYGARLVVARNHAKVTLAANHALDYYLAIESSANVNTNPRIEQTAMHASRELFDFYLEFFHGLRSIAREL